MNRTIIKIYKGEAMNADLQDLSLDTFQRKVDEIKAYGNANGLDVLVTAHQQWEIARFDSFVEVVSSEALTEEQQTYIKEWVKPFMQDAKIRRGTLCVKTIPFSILFYVATPYQAVTVKK